MSSKMIKLYDKNGNWCQPMTNHLISSGVIDGGKDFNNFLAQGEYNVSYDGTGDAPLNAPYSGIIWGKLFVEVNDNNIQNNSTNWLWQTFIDTSRRIYKRQKINNTSFTPWQRIYEETILYNNQSGTTGTVPLNESAVNFNYLEMYFRNNDDVVYFSQKVHSPNGKKITVYHTTYNISQKTFYVGSKIYNISGTSMNVDISNRIAVISGNSTDTKLYDNINCVMVIGYR